MSHAVLTGPITGTVTLADGTEVNVGPDEIPAESLEQSREIAHLIGLRLQSGGHPVYDNDPDPAVVFVHTPDDDFADYVPHPDEQTRLDNATARRPELVGAVESAREQLAFVAESVLAPIVEEG